MKKVLFMIPTLDGGGAERVLVNLVNSIDKSKFEITVLTLFNVGINRKLLNKDVKYNYIFNYKIKGLKHFLKLFNPRLLFKLFINEKYDCIVSYLEGETTRIISGCNYNTKLISWIHTENSKDYYVANRNKKEMLKCYDKMSKIIFVSQNVADSFNKYTNNIFINKGNVIKNIIDYDDIKKKSEEKIYLKKDVFRIIAIGRLTKVKDFNRLIPIIKKINDNRKKKNIELLILGTGEEENNIKSKIEQLNIKNIKLLGYQENPYKYLANSNLYICCSHYEGYSTTTNEALYLNIPIIATNCSGMQEILEQGKCGLIVTDNDEEIYDGICKIINDINYRNSIKKEQLIKINKMKNENIKNVKAVEALFKYY